MAEDLPHASYEIIADGLKNGDVIPFFGAAASAICRKAGEEWEPGKPFTPFGYELAAALARTAGYPISDGHSPDLALVASYAEHKAYRAYIDRKLRKYFLDARPGDLHAKLGVIEAAKLYVTTNYDDLIEQALTARQPHVVVDRGNGGLLVRVAGGTPRQMSPIGDELHKSLHDLETDEPSRPIVFKLHGSVDKIDEHNDAYLITEEDYVDFLGRTGDSYILPPYLAGLMEGKAFLFLGYSLTDWNVRVILRKILKKNPDRRIWAIVTGQSAAEQELWGKRGFEIYPMDLRVFAEKLAAHL